MLLKQLAQRTEKKILKAIRENNQVIYKGKPIKITADLSTETLKEKRHRMRYFRHGMKIISALQYSTQQCYHSKLMME
jgi:hypothetical protein